MAVISAGRLTTTIAAEAICNACDSAVSKDAPAAVNTSTTLKVGRDGMNQLVALQRGRLNSAQTRTHNPVNEINGGSGIGLRALHVLSWFPLSALSHAARIRSHSGSRRIGTSACIRVHLQFPDRARGAAEPRSDADEPGAAFGRSGTDKPRSAGRPRRGCEGIGGRFH